MTSPVMYTGETTARMSYHLTLPGYGPNGGNLVIEGVANANSANTPIARKYYSRELDENSFERHRNDAEAQLFDYLADQVWQACGRDDATYYAAAALATGTVSLGSDQGPCRSCRGIIKQFRLEFPKITVQVGYPKRDARNVWGDPKGGSYGYAAAVEDRGMWRIELLPHEDNAQGWRD